MILHMSHQTDVAGVELSDELYTALFGSDPGSVSTSALRNEIKTWLAIRYAIANSVPIDQALVFVNDNTTDIN